MPKLKHCEKEIFKENFRPPTSSRYPTTWSNKPRAWNKAFSDSGLCSEHLIPLISHESGCLFSWSDYFLQFPLRLQILPKHCHMSNIIQEISNVWQQKMSENEQLHDYHICYYGVKSTSIVMFAHAGAILLGSFPESLLVRNYFNILMQLKILFLFLAFLSVHSHQGYLMVSISKDLDQKTHHFKIKCIYGSFTAGIRFGMSKYNYSNRSV